MERGAHRIERPGSTRPFDLLLLVGVTIMVAGAVLGSPRARTAIGAAQAAMRRATTLELTVAALLLATAVAAMVGAAAYLAAARGRRPYTRPTRPPTDR
ncbi:MAG TPA: hypothetical protein VFR93_05230 [Candidatus Limnocylindrales bacterium]|nr:hypothetical protein [Candidatus Limnocylindrales bacterium]